MNDPHQSYESPDDNDVREFAKFPRGLAIAAAVGFMVPWLILLWVYLKLEGYIK
jgi:hypothetical protein